MPITLPVVSRRRFLRGSLAVAAGAWLVPSAAWGKADSTDRLALLSDIHIAADRRETRGKSPVNMWDQLKQASDGILAMPSRPSMVLVCGDCACQRGRREDYATVVEA